MVRVSFASPTSVTSVEDWRSAPRSRRRRAHSPIGIFLGMRRRSTAQADAVQHRLGSLFQVSEKAIARLDGATTVSYFVAGEPDPFRRSWCYQDDTSLSASAHPILTPDVLGDASGKSIRTFVRKLRHDSTELETLAPPVSYLHHNAIRDTIVAANDLLGLGRLYHVGSTGDCILSNSVLAAAVALEHDAVQDDKYWEAYYLTGGGLGSTTSVQEVTLAPPGSVVSISGRGLVLRQQHSVERLLRETKEAAPDLDDPVDAARRVVELARPFLPTGVPLGLSGGVDSRFVAALAIDLGLDFRARTYLPPSLEGEIARQLHERSSGAYPWRAVVVNPGTVRQDARAPQQPDQAAEPILARAEAWFSYLGGDHWSSLIRSNAPRRRTAAAPLALSGSHGDFNRAHYYSKRDLEASQDPAVPLKRFLHSFTRYRAILSPDLRARGAQLVRDALLDSMVQGMTGYYALDHSYLSHRVRRQFPPIVPSVVLPMLTPDMVLATFWRDPVEKATARVVRELTTRLVPAWEGVPYYHEAAEGTDPLLTNKVSVQTTYWEADAEDFWASVEVALADTHFSGVTLAAARREVSSLPEGRNRTNQTFEFLFWHYAAVRALAQVNRIRRLHPA